MLEYIYICRHGFRANWVDPSIKSSPTGMTRDPPLAVYGEEQCTTLGAFLSSSVELSPYPVPELVFSSPFYRCIQSALPTAQQLRTEVLLEHGVQEWYSPVIPDTGLHPRPASPATLARLFPQGTVSTTYESTLYPSRRGESLADVHARAELFVEAWIGRVESEWPEVKSVVVFGHAASIIALGRALTGDRQLDVVAGCASTSLYKRKPPTSLLTTTSPHPKSTPNPSIYPTPPASNPPPAPKHLLQAEADDLQRESPCGVGEWTIEWNAKTSYLPNGLERNWSFRDVVLKDDGEVISDRGDSVEHEGTDEWPEGLREGMDKYLRRGAPPFLFAGQGSEGGGGDAGGRVGEIAKM